MNLNITAQECQVLIEILTQAHKEVLHELHHTDTLDYKNMLMERLKTIEGLEEKLRSHPEAVNQPV